MKMKGVFKVTNFIDPQKWSDFVYNHPHGNIFQTPEMAEVYSRTKNREPISLAVIDTDSDEIYAFLQGALLKEISGFMSSFSSRSIIHGGPLFVYNENGIAAVKTLMIHYNEIAKKKSLYSEIRNLNDTSNFKFLFEDAGYKYEDHLNFLTDLTKPIDELRKQLYKSKRQAVNKAKKVGVVVEEITNKKLIPIFYDLVKKSYMNSKVPFADISLFESAFDVLVPQKMCKFFLAQYKGGYIASTCFLCYNGLIFDWYGGVDRAFSKYRANELLEWHSLKWCAENGYRIFDFGGAGKPGEPYGPRKFKQEFGGNLVSYGRWKKVHSPIKRKIAETGFELFGKMLIK